jgi:iron complex outermembrane receptor protein
MRLKVLQGSISAFCLLAAMPAWAQPPAPEAEQENPPPEPETQEPVQSEGITEIVVTAQRRAENIQDVPIAITAFSAEDLQAQGISNTLELARFVPNLVGQNNTGIGSANSYFLRGLGSTETIATFDPPVGTYVDDIYLSRQNANNLSLFDVERIEVLRGPQGTLFGRNTTGGAINVIMRQPGRDFGGFVELGYGRFDQVLARGSIDLPLTEGIAVKVSGYFQDDEGYVRNVTTNERLNDNDGWGARLGVRAEFSPALSWRASYMHVVSRAENILNFECNPGSPGGLRRPLRHDRPVRGGRPGALCPAGHQRAQSQLRPWPGSRHRHLHLQSGVGDQQRGHDQFHHRLCRPDAAIRAGLLRRARRPEPRRSEPSGARLPARRLQHPQ